MKYTSMIVLLVQATVAHSEIVTVQFAGTVTNVVGSPFGIAAKPGITPVTGMFKYDTTTEQYPVNPSTNASRYLAPIEFGFVWKIGGVTISSSDYLLHTSNEVENFGGSDLFQAVADDDGLEQTGMGDDFRVNGIPGRGVAQLMLVDTDRGLFRTDADVDTLPHGTSLTQVDFVWGYLGDQTIDVIERTDRLFFRGRIVPEPSTARLLVLLSFALSYPRRARC